MSLINEFLGFSSTNPWHLCMMSVNLWINLLDLLVHSLTHQRLHGFVNELIDLLVNSQITSGFAGIVFPAGELQLLTNHVVSQKQALMPQANFVSFISTHQLMTAANWKRHLVGLASPSCPAWPAWVASLLPHTLACQPGWMTWLAQPA